jgi:hypothetical protein
VHTSSEPALVPYITLREGEEAAPANLIILKGRSGPKLCYRDEDPRDRTVRDVLMARCEHNRLDKHGQPMGDPVWKFMHPFRQVISMQYLRCQVCTQSARTPVGFVFLTANLEHDLAQPSIITNQPPVCARHIRAAVRLCDHVSDTAFVVQSAPLYGFQGVLYGYDVNHQVQAVAHPDAPLPLAHPELPLLLASQMYRRLSSLRVVEVDELVRELRLSA